TATRPVIACNRLAPMPFATLYAPLATHGQGTLRSVTHCGSAAVRRVNGLIEPHNPFCRWSRSGTIIRSWRQFDCMPLCLENTHQVLQASSCFTVTDLLAVWLLAECHIVAIAVVHIGHIASLHLCVFAVVSLF